MTAPADDIEDADPGSARDRTTFAWTRTALSFAALGGLLLKTQLYVGLIVLALSVVIWELRRLAPQTAPGRTGDRRLLLMTVAICVVSLTVLVTSLLGNTRGLHL
ncbi:MAG TPA: DUF202 domain-containing protein [Streptosporangiaceae bacterium]|nr:DUF202 domain-containing protein [Streptosporangiaceae bacterium]